MSPTNRAQRYFVTKANPTIGNGQLCVLKLGPFRKTSRICLFGSLRKMYGQSMIVRMSSTGNRKSNDGCRNDKRGGWKTDLAL